MSVMYEELAPKEFLERLEACPVGWLPLGTLEWHSLHNPLGTDMIQGTELFRLAAEKFGGIVFPPLFLGPDRRVTRPDGTDLIGMDCYYDGREDPPYPAQKLPGSCYWVGDDTFRIIIEAIVSNASRQGFRVLMGVGHGPSTDLFAAMAGDMKEKYGVTLLTPYMGRPEVRFIHDHAAKSETSNMMLFRPELVHMDRLSPDPEVLPLGIGGEDPRYSASPEYAAANLPKVLEHIGKLVEDALS